MAEPAHLAELAQLAEPAHLAEQFAYFLPCDGNNLSPWWSCEYNWIDVVKNDLNL